jgi:hypothetical protein
MPDYVISGKFSEVDEIFTACHRGFDQLDLKCKKGQIETLS